MSSHLRQLLSQKVEYFGSYLERMSLSYKQKLL